MDNIALVPASLLPLKDEWQTFANGLEPGSILICMPEEGKCRNTVEELVGRLREKGYSVVSVPSGRFEHPRGA